MMTTRFVPPCDVCDVSHATAGGLACKHRFCPDCFRRYVHGSVNELDVSLRCCACGRISELIVQLSNQDAHVNFGRHTDMKLLVPVGMTQNSDGNYIIVDKKAKRVKIFSQQGRTRGDFAYIHNTEPTHGVTVIPNGDIAMASRDANYEFIHYYTTSGAFKGSAFIQSGANRPSIQGVACDRHRDTLYVTDSNNSCVHVISNKTKLQYNRIQLEPIQFEVEPSPSGITVTDAGELYITDVANHCLKVYTQNGSFCRKIGCFGERPTQFRSPTGVAVTSEGEILVADRGNQRVQCLDSQGAFLRYVVCFKADYDVYMAPDDVIVSTSGHVSILMSPTQAADVGEVRAYP